MRKLLLAFCFLIASSVSSADEVLITNANGYTFVDTDLTRFEWMHVEDGRVVDLGTGKVPTADNVIDMGGRTVLPGLTDAHGHVLGLGQFRSQVDLVGAGSLEETLQRVADRAVVGKGWLIGRGWNQELWPDRQFPTANDLDRVVSDRPVWLSRIDGHAGWANSMAMNIAGIDRHTADPVGGRIMRYPDGESTGIFVDAAEALIQTHIPAPDDTAIRQDLLVAQKELNALGVTGVHDAGVDARTLAIYKSMADDGDLSIRIYAMMSGTGENLDAVGAPLIAYGDDMLSARSVKIYVDGALGSRGAALLEDYQDDPGNQGLAFLSSVELGDEIAKATRMGFQVNVHAIGDRGNRIVLDALESEGVSGDLARPRIEHAQVVSPEDFPRFLELNVIASMQPTHATSDMNMAEDRIGSERIAGAYAWRRFVDQGTLVVAGSDFPVESANPFFGLFAAVSRTDHDGFPEGGWYPDQALTREEALQAFTINAAYAAFQEDRLGTLAPGNHADFIVIDRDYFGADENLIWQTQVNETWVGGKRVFPSESD